MNTESHSLEKLGDVAIPIRVEVAKSELAVEEILNWQAGTVIAFNKIVGEPIDIYLSDRLSARGEVVVVNNRYGIRISEITRPDEE